MSSLVMGTPNPRQREFLTSKVRYTAFGGARGGGKSWAVRFKAVGLCLRYPGIKVMIIRKTYPELRANHILPLVELLHCYDPDKDRKIASYNDSNKEITFPSGSKILFRYCANDADAERFQGTEVDVLFIDEATHQSEARFDKLKVCVRGVNDFPKRVYLTCNPGGEGHAWVKRLFIDKVYSKGENPDDYCFIRSLVTDNRALMISNPDYIKQLEALPPKLREAWLKGNWDIFEGQYFEEFRERPDMQAAQHTGLSEQELLAQHRWTHVIEPFEPSPSWKIYRAYDWGYGKPFACAWFAVDYDDTAYMILELYGCVKGEANEGVKWDNDKQFAEIARIEREHPWLRGKEIIGVADPSIWDGSKGKSAAQCAKEHGIIFKPGINDRVPGWMQVRYRLVFDENGRSKLYFFNTCEAIIRTMPLMMYDEHIPEDLDSDLEDHILDATRYFCMLRQVAPARVDHNRTAIANDPLSDDNLKIANNASTAPWRR